MQSVHVSPVLLLHVQAVAGNHTDGLNSLAENLKQLVGDGRTIVDKDDVIFLSRVIEGLSRSVGSNEKVSKRSTVSVPYIE